MSFMVATQSRTATLSFVSSTAGLRCLWTFEDPKAEQGLMFSSLGTEGRACLGCLGTGISSLGLPVDLMEEDERLPPAPVCCPSVNRAQPG